MRLRTLTFHALVVLACCAVVLVPAALAMLGPDGSFDPTALRAWIDARPTWVRGAFVAAMLACIAVEFDMLGRIAAIPLARFLPGGNATPRQFAGLRLVSQVLILALVALWTAANPETFPRSGGWTAYALVAAVALHVVLSAKTWLTSGRSTTSSIPQ